MYLLGTTEEKRALRIKGRRKQLKLTQQMASERCDLPLRTFQRAEDITEKVDVSTLRAISEGMGIPLGDLLGEGKPISSREQALEAKLRLFHLINFLDEMQVADLLGNIEDELGISPTEALPVLPKKAK